MLGRDAIEAADESYGIDFEGEVAVVTDDVPMGISPRPRQQDPAGDAGQ
jgi:fumarylacetoacetate (FAA) hydrolase